MFSLTNLPVMHNVLARCIKRSIKARRDSYGCRMKTNILLTDDQLFHNEPDLAELRRAYELRLSSFQVSREMLERLIQRGSVMAMVYLGAECRRNSLREQSIKYYRSAYENGSSTALFSLAQSFYLDGNFAEAEALWRDGVSKNDPVSMYRLARLYLEKNKKSIIPILIKRLLEDADNLGQLRATLLLGCLYLKAKFGISRIPIGFILMGKVVPKVIYVHYRDPYDRRLW